MLISRGVSALPSRSCDFNRFRYLLATAALDISVANSCCFVVQRAATTYRTLPFRSEMTQASRILPRCILGTIIAELKTVCFCLSRLNFSCMLVLRVQEARPRLAGHHSPDFLLKLDRRGVSLDRDGYAFCFVGFRVERAQATLGVTKLVELTLHQFPLVGSTAVDGVHDLLHGRVEQPQAELPGAARFGDELDHLGAEGRGEAAVAFRGHPTHQLRDLVVGRRKLEHIHPRQDRVECLITLRDRVRSEDDPAVELETRRQPYQLGRG